MYSRQKRKTSVKRWQILFLEHNQLHTEDTQQELRIAQSCFSAFFKINLRTAGHSLGILEFLQIMDGVLTCSEETVIQNSQTATSELVDKCSCGVGVIFGVCFNIRRISLQFIYQRVQHFNHILRLLELVRQLGKDEAVLKSLLYATSIYQVVLKLMQVLDLKLYKTSKM